MKILAFFTNHTHYWGVPHTRTADNKLIQVCYECSQEREVKIELRTVESILNPGSREAA